MVALEHQRHRSALFAVTVGIALGCAACTGVIDPSGASRGSTGGPMDGATPGGGSGAVGAGGSAGTPATMSSNPEVPKARLHKLTSSEFANSMHDLLGKDVPLAEVEPDTELDGFNTIGASVVSVSAAGVSLYETAVDEAVAYAFENATRAASVLSCIPQSTTDACLSSALQAFGRRAFRRPLSAEETARFTGLASAIGDEAKSVLIGLRYAVSAILQSPSFLYRAELGAPSQADGGRLKYTSFEMTSRLAATLWNTVPDAELLNAADNDGLATAEAVRAQAERMLAAPRAHDALATFVDDLYGMDRLAITFKDAATFPEWNDSLRASMHEELTRRIDDLVFTTKGDFLSLYDNRTVFVNNQLAKIYGLPEVMPDAFRKLELPADSPRVGLLGSGAILAAYALPQRTSPTARGKFVNLTLLCKAVPPPPPGVDTSLPPTADPNASVRQRLEAHRTNPTCASCHTLMDPIGLGLESFDSLGRYRTADNGHPIDPSGDVNGAHFASAAELGARLRQDPAAAACVVSKLYAHAQGRSSIALDEAALAELSRQFDAAGHRADQLLVSLVASDAFRFVVPAAP